MLTKIAVLNMDIQLSGCTSMNLAVDTFRFMCFTYCRVLK